MQKYILLSLIAISGTAFAQPDSDKKFNAGVGITTGLNLNKAATKRMEVNGVGSVFCIGLVANYDLSNTIAFSTGLDISFETNKIKSSADFGKSYYEYDGDSEIELNKDAVQGTSTLYNWTERKQKPVYLTLPTMLAFSTKYFGDFKYTAKFGLRTSFLLGNKINDQGFTFDNNLASGTPVAADNSNMEASRDMIPIRSSAGIAFGTEWNFSGSTALCAELGYYYGFVPIYNQAKEENRTLYNLTSQTRDYYSNNMTQSQLLFKVSVLF